MGSTVKAVVQLNELRAIEMRRQKPPMTFAAIAKELDMAGEGAAYNCFMRGVRRLRDKSLSELRDDAVAVCDAAIESNIIPMLDGDEGAGRTVDRFLRQKVNILGLAHEHGIADRQMALSEQTANIFMKGLEIIMAKMELTPEQRERLPMVVETSLAELAASTEPIDLA